MTASLAALPASASTSPQPDPGRGGQRVTGLDGLRGFALIGMLAWHAELDWVQGGFARMTIFFVLSGYLATRSWGRRRREGFRSFWVRRTMRLLPMTLVGVGLAIAVTLAVGSQTTRAALAADVVSVLSYTSNWHFLDSGQSYGALFERQSAFQHYWSLSIEEQLFLLLPVLLATASILARRIRRSEWAVLAGGAVAVGVIAVIAAPSPDGIYFGTQTRLIEFLVGAALAVSFGSWSTAGPSVRRLIGWVGRLAGVAIVVTLALVDRGSSWLYDGGIYLFAVPVIAVVAAIELREPWLTRTLELQPLVWLGRAALSIYVLHWPLFVLVEDVAPSSVSEPALAAVKVALGVAVGGFAHRLIEQPLLDDTRRLLRDGLPVLRTRLAPMMGSACVLAVVAVGVGAPEPDYEFEDAAAAFAAGQPHGERVASGVRVSVFGSSTALMNGLGVDEWAHTTEDVDFVSGDARLGCGLVQAGQRPQSLDARGQPVWFPVDEACADWPEDWERVATETQPDVALVFFGVWEIADWRLDGSQVTSIEEPAFRSDLRAALNEGVDRLLSGGAEHVVLMTSPVVGGGTSDHLAAARGLPEDHADRTSTFNRLLQDEAGARPGDVTVFHYGAMIEDLGDDYLRLLPDGVHPTWGGAAELWSGEVGSALLDHLGAIGR